MIPTVVSRGASLVRSQRTVLTTGFCRAAWAAMSLEQAVRIACNGTGYPGAQWRRTDLTTPNAHRYAKSVAILYA